MTSHAGAIRGFGVWAIVLMVVSAVSGCATLQGGYETPKVTVSSFRALPSSGGMPSFEIGLRIINPNRIPLELRGVSYTVSLEGHEIITGVGNDLPVVEAYGEGEVKLVASANLLAGIRLLSDLMRNDRGRVDYRLQAKLDVGTFWPAIRVKDVGSINLR